MEAFAPGFGSGLVCVASCGPVLLSYLAAERAALKATTALLSVFLLGRLLAHHRRRRRLLRLPRRRRALWRARPWLKSPPSPRRVLLETRCC